MDTGIDDESSHPVVVFRRCRWRYIPTELGVRLFREPDALCGLPIYVAPGSQPLTPVGDQTSSTPHKRCLK